MSVAKQSRNSKRQLGQFLTPLPLAREIVASLELSAASKVLEPSFGEGAFLIALVEKFLTLHTGTHTEKMERIFAQNLYGVEIDPQMYARCASNIEKHFGCIPANHNLVLSDFFAWHTPLSSEPLRFDVIVGNPPFGGTLNPASQDKLDSLYGIRGGEKIKKETYSFFTVKSFDLLKMGGRIRFICSDTFLTIRTMRGLRKLLQYNGRVALDTLNYFSEETSHPMVLLDYEKTGQKEACILVNHQRVLLADIEQTGNFSWGIDADFAPYFSGTTLADFVVASSGMTVGNNELFVRKIHHGKQESWIEEPYAFAFYDDPITLEKEIGKARLGKLSAAMRQRFCDEEAAGRTRRNVRAIPLSTQERRTLPHPDYCPYNKGNGRIISQMPEYVIYWKDEGDAVYTYKKNGNWYLHGVGGQKHFKREGITWQLIAPRIHAKYLPAGFILDSGAPAAFLKPDVPHDELYFILGWLLTDLCNDILKTVINHTRNIQSKDLERLPYPFWVLPERKSQAINAIQSLVEQAKSGAEFTYHSPEILALNALFDWSDSEIRAQGSKSSVQSKSPQMELFA